MVRNNRKFFRSRSPELRLLIPALIIAACAFALAFWVRHSQGTAEPGDLILQVAFIAACFGAHGLLVAFGSRCDETILPVLALVNGLGLAYQYRLNLLAFADWRSPAIWVHCAVPLVVVITGLIFQGNRLVWLKRSAWLWGAGAIAVPAAVFFTGVAYRGGLYGPGKTTPAEIVKPLFIIFLGAILCRYGPALTRGRSIRSRPALLACLIILMAWSIPQIGFLLLRDLGMIAATGILLIFMLTAATGRLLFAALGAGGIAACGLLFKTFLTKGQVRFEAWLNPFAHPADSGFQIIQSLFALFHGEFLGRGAGAGFPQKIPLAGTDFVYAAMAEEFGLLGSSLILIGFLYLAYRGFYWASRTDKTFSALVGVGAGALIWTQVLLNVGGVIKLIPLTGVPLPFISRGGTAALTFAVLIGWILALSTERST